MTSLPPDPAAVRPAPSDPASGLPAPGEPVTWVIGAQGLLGSAVCRELARLRRPYVRHAIPWESPELAVAQLRERAGELLAPGHPWRIVWCAGAGVIGTSQQQLDAEVEVLGALLTHVQPAVDVDGAVFLASSAGGVYAGSTDSPFTELTPAVAISPYGHAKLAAERVVTQFGARTGLPVLIGRIANLYGPGQDIRKPQGLISQLCRAHLTREPVSIYVPLDTARDYLFVDDAAAMVVAGLERAAAEGGVHVKILASGRPTSVAAILAELRRVSRRRPQIVLGASPNSRFQVRDLRFRSVVWPDLDVAARTTLAAGVAATLESLGRELRAGVLLRR